MVKQQSALNPILFVFQGILLALCLMLASCHEQKNETYYLLRPEELKATAYLCEQQNKLLDVDCGLVLRTQQRFQELLTILQNNEEQLGPAILQAEVQLAKIQENREQFSKSNNQKELVAANAAYEDQAQNIIEMLAVIRLLHPM